MMDDSNQHDVGRPPGDPLLEKMQRLANGLDREQFPGQAWPVRTSQRSQRPCPWRLVAPATALAASVLLGALLWYGQMQPRPTSIQRPLASPPAGSGTVQAASLPPREAFLDPAVLGQVHLPAPDIRLPAGSITLSPVRSRLVGPDSYTWDIPDIHLSSL